MRPEDYALISAPAFRALCLFSAEFPARAVLVHHDRLQGANSLDSSRDTTGIECCEWRKDSGSKQTWLNPALSE